MAVEEEIHLSENVLWADIHTFPTGFAAAGIQDDIRGLRVMARGGVIFHFLFLYAYCVNYIQRGVLAW
jgi:hypothetical protein